MAAPEQQLRGGREPGDEQRHHRVPEGGESTGAHGAPYGHEGKKGERLPLVEVQKTDQQQKEDGLDQGEDEVEIWREKQAYYVIQRHLLPSFPLRSLPRFPILGRGRVPKGIAGRLVGAGFFKEVHRVVPASKHLSFDAVVGPEH